MTDDATTKRLIISGLTPAITVDDINHRLSSFGSVKAIDGFGLLDGLGQPRKFGYVTLETTPSRLSKCMNVLSGSVWKGTKLRLGEATPDYKERIVRESQEVVKEPPKKRRRFDVVHAGDMSLVTPENAAQRPGWKVSALGRITHPLKIRPLRPLTEMHGQMTKSKLILRKSLTRKGLDKKVKNIRARRRTIDMTKWGSTYLKGNFLNSVTLPVSTVDNVELQVENSDESADSDTVDDEPTTLPMEELARNPNSLLSATSQDRTDPPTFLDMEREKTQTLTFLNSLFGDNRDEDWNGRESVVSDVELAELAKEECSFASDAPTFEEVPRMLGNAQPNPPAAVYKEDTNNKNRSKPPSSVADVPTIDVTPPVANVITKLKDLFAPREEAAFSLLDHLDLDIGLDDELSFLEEPMSTELITAHEPSQNLRQVQPAPRTSHAQLSGVVLNPKQALFFPLLPSDTKELKKARQRDAYDLIRENGWYWRDRAVRFWNTESEEEIRERWESCRGELTRSWKQKWREAGKVRRRKKLVDEAM